MMKTIKPVEVNWAQILNVNQNNTIVFRVDASEQIGSGHVMRCLTLADEICGNCNRIIFCCRDLPGNMIAIINNRGYQVIRLASDNRFNDVDEIKKILLEEKLIPDWLIVDHYKISKEWEQHLKPLVKRIMVIDDLADREHDCDLLLDQNYYRNPEIRYWGLVPESCRQLLGPKYALLRREFKEIRKTLRVRDGSVKRILVFYGGSDPTNETAKALEAIKILKQADIVVDVVVGAANPNREQIRLICSQMSNVNFYCQVENIAELMARADLTLGAGGTATWERCYLGLPSLVTIVAENQRETVEVLAEEGVIWNLGWHGEVGPDKLGESIELFMNNTEPLMNMSRLGLALF